MDQATPVKLDGVVEVSYGEMGKDHVSKNTNLFRETPADNDVQDRQNEDV